MLSSGPVSLKTTAEPVKRLLASLLVLLTISGCGTQWFPETLEADPDAISEVRNVGREMAHITTGLIYENTTQNIDILIFDVGASSFQDALYIARDRLLQRGWVIEGRASNSLIMMESKKWEQTSVSIEPMKSLESYGITQEPQVAKILKDDPAKSAAYVVLAVTPYN